MADSIDESKNVSVTDDDLENKSKGELIKLAGQLRDRRNELNQLASERASKRDDLNAKANELFDEVDEMKADLELDEGKGIDQLESEIEDLEFKQQTEVLSAEEERELIEKIEDKRERLQEKREKLNQSGSPRLPP